MSESHAIIRYYAPNEAIANRVKFYLENDTRPAFEEDVPPKEVEIFKAFEFAPLPRQIERPDGVTVDAWIENVEASDMEELMLAFKNFNLKGIYGFFSDDEEYKAYFKVVNGKLKRLYRIEANKALDEKLWELDWDERALSLIIERFG